MTGFAVPRQNFRMPEEPDNPIIEIFPDPLPIETAPRDGTEVIVFYHADPARGPLVAVPAHYVAMDGVNCWFARGTDLEAEPIYWLPRDTMPKWPPDPMLIPSRRLMDEEMIEPDGDGDHDRERNAIDQ